MNAMLSKRKTLLSLVIAISLGGTAAADTLGVNAQAGAGLRSQIESESRGMLGSRGALGARAMGHSELGTSIQADGEASISAGSTQVGGSASGEAEVHVDGRSSVDAESRRAARRGAAAGAAVESAAEATASAALGTTHSAIGTTAGTAVLIGAEARETVRGALGSGIDAEVAGEMAQAINAEVVGEVAAAVAAEIEQALASEVEAAIEQEIQSSIDAELQTAVTGLVGR
jgi:hypothetical protein